MTSPTHLKYLPLSVQTPISVARQHLYLKPSITALMRLTHCPITDMRLKLQNLPWHHPTYSSTRNENLPTQAAVQKAYLATGQTGRMGHRNLAALALFRAQQPKSASQQLHYQFLFAFVYLGLQPATDTPKGELMENPRSLQKTAKNNPYGSSPVLLPGWQAD